MNTKTSSELNIYQRTKNILKIKDKKSEEMNNLYPLSPSSINDHTIIRKPTTYKDQYNREDNKISKTKQLKKRNRTIDQHSNYRSNYQSVSTENSKEGSFSKNSTKGNNNFKIKSTN